MKPASLARSGASSADVVVIGAGIVGCANAYHLARRGVRTVLIHPPFNPDFYRQIEDTPYGAGLLAVEAVTARLTAAHGASVVGSFDPAVTGCVAAMFIDAEHSSPACLKRLIDLVPGL